MRTFTPDDLENRFTQAHFSAQQFGIHSQHDWTKSIDKMNFIQLVDDAAEKFEVPQAVIIADLAKQALLRAQFFQLQSEYNKYVNKLFINGKESTLRRCDWRDLINGNCLIDSILGIFGYPWYVKEINIIWTVFDFPFSTVPIWLISKCI